MFFEEASDHRIPVGSVEVLFPFLYSENRYPVLSGLRCWISIEDE